MVLLLVRGKLRRDRAFDYDRRLKSARKSLSNRRIIMLRKIVSAGLMLLFFAGLVLAQEKATTKDASGTVKSVAATSITITDDAKKDWTFVVDKETTVIAKGASHKMREAEGANKATQITDFVMEKQSVSLKYEEKDGKSYVREIRVK